MVLFIPLGAKVFARSMMYCSLALRTLSRLSRNCSSGNICMSSRVCPVRNGTYTTLLPGSQMFTTCLLRDTFGQTNNARDE